MMRCVFLDLDGTLMDSGPSILASFQHGLRSVGRSEISGDTSWIVGPSLWVSYGKLGLEGEELDCAISAYRAYYIETAMLQSVPYDGALDQVRQLHEDGYTLCLATSKAHVYATQITAHFGFSRYFEREFGSELDGTRTEKTPLLAYGLDQMGLHAQDAIMVGDRMYDVKGAKANNMPVIGVTYGYGTDQELRSAGADEIVHSPQELRQSVHKFLPL